MELIIRALRCPPPDRPQTIAARFGPHGGRIGRYYTCALALRDPEHFISREHLDVRFHEGRFVLKVISQVNGATVNDVVISPGGTIELSDGDRIQLGRYEFVAELREPTETKVRNDAFSILPQPVREDPQEAASRQSHAALATRPAIGASAEEMLLALAAGLQVDPAALDAGRPLETVRLVGELLRSSVEGMHRALHRRRALDPPAALDEGATLEGHECNPLEHSESPRDALRYLVDLRRHARGVFMRPGEALQDALAQVSLPLDALNDAPEDAPEDAPKEPPPRK